MIPFSTFALPKVHASICREGILREGKDSDLDDLFGPSKEREIPEQPEEIPHLKLPHKTITREEFFDTPHAALDKPLSEHYAFGEQHANIIARYTGSHHSDGDVFDANAFRYINARILGLHDHRLLPQDHERMKMMDEALHLHRTPHELTVYSGMRENHGEIIAANDKVHHPAYLSTSTDPSLAVSFAGHTSHGWDTYSHVLKIHVPAGHPGAYVNHVSRHPSEREFILPRDTTLRIDHNQREHIASAKRYGSGYHHYFIHNAYPETK